MRGLYRGFVPLFFRDIPTYGVYFLTYNFYQKLLGLNPKDSISSDNKSAIIKKMIAGGFAGQSTWFFAYPFDIIKTIAQSGTNNPGMLKISRQLY